MIRLIEVVTLTLKVEGTIPWAQVLDLIKRRNVIAEPRCFSLSVY